MLSVPAPASKSRDVVYAELALGAWTVWTCLFGIYQTWRQIPEIENALNDQLQGMISITPESMLHMAIAGYIGLAAMSALVIIKIGQRKHWARSTTLWSCGLQALTILWPPYHAPLEYLSEVPDLGLQIYAVYFLYTASSRAWFDAKDLKPSA